MSFEQKLLNHGYDPSQYMAMVKRNIKYYYDEPLEVKFCDDGKHKIQIMNPVTKKWVKFGGYDNLDFLMYQMLEKKKKVPKLTADVKQQAYLARATKIKGRWKENPYSPNMFAIYILWM